MPLGLVTGCGVLTNYNALAGAPTPQWFSSSLAGLNDTPILMFVFFAALIAAGCYATMWYHSRITHLSKVILWRTVKLNLPIKNLKKFVKLLHVSGCSVAMYNSKKMVTKESKVVSATFRDSNLLHWMGEYPMLTLEVCVPPNSASTLDSTV